MMLNLLTEKLNSAALVKDAGKLIKKQVKQHLIGKQVEKYNLTMKISLDMENKQKNVQPVKEDNMTYWLQSLQQNGFDVFIVVYLALLFIGYHYLMRWFINNKFDELYRKLK